MSGFARTEAIKNRIFPRGYCVETGSPFSSGFCLDLSPLRVAKRDAQAIAAKVQSIISAQVAGNDLPTATAEWLATIGDDLHQTCRLAERLANGWKSTLRGTNERSGIIPLSRWAEVATYCKSTLGKRLPFV
jgi:hypothetical protein